jgi:hypothetical protein
MAVQNANYVFLPWVREGAAADIHIPDSLLADQAGVVSVSAKLRVNSAPEDIAREVRLYGPGDVIGIDPQQVIRTEPRHLATDFEPNYFPAIEFDRPDFPWLFTPAKANDAGKLRPWLCLIVVRKQEGVTLSTDRNLPLSVLDIKEPAIPGRELPDLSESWAWVHTQVAGVLLTGNQNEATKSLTDSLKGDPALTLSRLLCPRRLDPVTDYMACVVPAFELGRKAGLGLPIELDDEKKLEPAWVLGTAPVKLPVYFHWEFSTGISGDFEELVRRLEARQIPDKVGKRPIDISQPGFQITPALPSGSTLELEGALRIPQPPPTDNAAPTVDWPIATKTLFQTALRSILNVPSQALPMSEDPLLAPPIYGCWQAGRQTVETTPPPSATLTWLDELNLDPRHRAVAALGTSVIQTQQEQLMASAWEQLGEIQRINQMKRQAQLGRAVNAVYYTKHFSRFPDEAFFKVVAPAQSRVVLPDSLSARGVVTTPVKILLAKKIADSYVPSNLISAPIRRISRPRGPINRQFLRAGTTGVGVMFTFFNIAGSSSTDMTSKVSGAVTIDDVSENLSSSIQNNGGLIWNPDPPAHWERASVNLMQVLNLLRPNHLSGYYISQSEPQPPTPFEFYEAAIAHQNYLSQAFRSINIDPLPILNINNLKSEVLASLNPFKTIPNVVHANFTINGQKQQTDDLFEPIMDAPMFPQPMYEALRDHSQDFLFPGLEFVPPDTVTLLETNPSFVESFLVGLNTEMNRELLWRNYPTDQRGTYFLRFWDTSVDNSQSPDNIDMINKWGDTKLGNNVKTGEQLVLLIRGELLRRYPNSVIYAVPAVKNGEQLDLHPNPNEELHPLFRGTLKPDVTFLGFKMKKEDAIADPGFFFVIQEHPTEPRFGLDAAKFDKLLPELTTWNNLNWRHLANTEEELKVLSHASINTVLPDIDKAKWGKNSSHQAYITLQRPVRIAIHAKDMILQKPKVTNAPN